MVNIAEEYSAGITYKQVKSIPREAFLVYEIHSASWASQVRLPLLRRLASAYFSWKVDRKYTKMVSSLAEREILELTGFLSGALSTDLHDKREGGI